MHLFPFLVLLTLLLHGANDANATNEAPEVPPVEATVLVNNPKDFGPDKKSEKPDEKMDPKCHHTDYRSYVKCLLHESKREKRQGYQQCSGNGCAQSCTGTGCPPANQHQCIGTGCLQGGQQQCGNSGCVQTVQQPCSGTGCVFFGYNCGGTGCTQVGQNCHGVGCVPPCAGSSCNAPSEPRTNIVDDEFRREIGSIRQDLGLMKSQNERLIKQTEKATSFILQLVNRQDRGPTVVREPVLVGHNSTTNIDINNYMNNHNVVNVPETKRVVETENKTQCCVVVRPKTCRRTSRPPYFGCGHKRHRTCGTICSGKRVVYSHVRPGCTADEDENCVSYHSHPLKPTGYPGYPTSGYYPPVPMYYPMMYAPPPMMAYPPPQIPIYAPPCNDSEDCEDWEAEVEAEDCEDTDAECKLGAKREEGESTGIRSYRNVPFDEILRVEKETQAIKRSEDQLSTSIDMLQKAVELKKIDEVQKKKEESLSRDETIGVSQIPLASSPKPSFSSIELNKPK